MMQYPNSSNGAGRLTGFAGIVCGTMLSSNLTVCICNIMWKYGIITLLHEDRYSTETGQSVPLTDIEFYTCTSFCLPIVIAVYWYLWCLFVISEIRCPLCTPVCLSSHPLNGSDRNYSAARNKSVRIWKETGQIMTTSNIVGLKG